MKNYFAILLIPVCLYAQTVQPPPQRARMGICTTMRHHYLPDSLDNLNCEIIPFASTMDVMASLRSGQIDIAYVGRPVKVWGDIDEMETFARQSGWTIVGRSKKMIEESTLLKTVVHTVADSHTIGQYLPEAITIRRHESISEALDSCGPDEVVFLSWDDYDESFPLVIPFNSDGKIPRFRKPMIYCHDDDKGKYRPIVKVIGDYISQKEKFNR